MTPPATAGDGHFSRLVAHWSHFGPPLRPSPSDTATVQATIDRLPPQARAIVLGLTPETIACAWPAGTRLLALDHDAAMVHRLWPNPGAQVALARWQAMPVPDKRSDIVCADGCHTPLPFPDGFDGLARETARVLRPGGHFVVRVFVRTDAPQTLDAIADDLANGRVGSVHALKLRLLAALHDGRGTCLDAVWRAWKRLPALPLVQAGTPGWTDAEIQGIESYAGLAMRYHLPTRDTFEALHREHFDTVSSATGAYEQASQCPTLVLRRR